MFIRHWGFSAIHSLLTAIHTIRIGVSISVTHLVSLALPVNKKYHTYSYNVRNIHNLNS